MQSTPSLLLAALALTTVSVTAQTPCDVNYYPIRLVDSLGVPATISTLPGNISVAQFNTESVYMSFANLPDGIYQLYVHVTDILDGINDAVLSTNDPADRFVTVVKTNGIVDISLPLTNNQNPNIIVTIADGNEILLVTPVRNSVTDPCLFKVWFGDTIDLNLPGGQNSPYMVRGSNATTCALTSYHYFRIGDATPGSDIRGTAFSDTDRDGTRDAGEGPLVGWEVRLVTATTSQSVFTDAAGQYTFPNVPAGSYTVEFVLQPGYTATTTSAFAVETCGCADVGVVDFGAGTIVQVNHARTIGYWRNNHGTALVQQLGILATLPSLCLANATGTMNPPPQTIAQWRSFLQGANAVNMAYMLSAQLAAMHCNVLAGNVGAGSMISDPVLGNITIGDLMAQAVAALCNDGYTPAGDPNRELQTNLKNALDNANNNRNWL